MNYTHPKVTAAFFSGAVVTVALGLINQFVGFDPDPEWVAALTTVVATLAGWLVPSRFAPGPEEVETIDEMPEEPTDYDPNRV